MTHPPSYIYKIPLSCLTGHIALERSPLRKQSATPLLAPIGVGCEKTLAPKRSPLIRTKRLQPQTSDEQSKDRHDSSGSDSGITILKPSDISPPESPYQTFIGHVVFSDVETDIV